MNRKTIAFYISDYGYGHASRSIAIIRELLKREDQICIIVCHSFALTFMKASLLEDRVRFREIETDVGYVLQKCTIYPDYEAVSKKMDNFINDFPGRSLKESEFLKNEKVDLLITDISPLPLYAASLLGIPTIGISNFTWYTAYHGLVPAKQLKWLRKQYQLVDYFFHLGASRELNWGRKQNIAFLFFAREIDTMEVQRIRKSIPVGKQVVFIGLGMKVDNLVEKDFPIWDSPNCHFIVSSNMKIKKTNVTVVPRNYIESQNYLAATDLIISKPGWGTISEALLAKKPLILLDRKDMQEDQVTITFLKELNRCSTIQWEELKRLIISKDYIRDVRNEQDLITSAKSCLSDISNQILYILYS
ncbi:uncharacterized protein (TIGR00661 family) [Bacillus tianshenii]|uniref:Uncharacterized protein (TIGR00661 family) n=1 Tax=Sutcliffiella tianshenii TaxID=1463404 RepID=A0ABS2NV98_9BACI|nr:glycosyltransferase [Bacillus tianshenii]MBM7618574.1 uncharacterized protein (TIGR00661 family) [Bacillus tianshenii]